MKKFLSLLFSLAILFQGAHRASPEVLSVSAKAAILLRADTGEAIYEKSADLALPMASTTKIMTCALALRYLDDLSEIITVRRESCGIEGSSLYMKEGDRVSAKDLLYALMLRSANDAAAALAAAVSGSEEEFVALMNRSARSLGMTSTSFKNPHGLPEEGHFTSCRDLARLTRAALSDARFLKIVSTREYVVKLNGDEMRPVKNHNRLLFSYDGACGVKTGYTKEAGRCLVSFAKRDGVGLICVTLDAPDDWDDHKKLFDYGFSSLERRVLFEEGEIFREIPLFGTGSVACSNSYEVSAVVKRSSRVTYRVIGKRYENTSYRAGETVCVAVIYEDGREIFRVPLYAVRINNSDNSILRE